MWISKRTDYATRAVLALAIAGDAVPLKMHEIAARTHVPESLLEQILAQLRGAGIVRSERGPHGGYRLNHPTGEITLERVVRLFQGPLAPIACATRSEPEPCPMELRCTLRDAWREVRDATISILERKTFADLARRAGGPWIEPGDGSRPPGAGPRPRRRAPSRRETEPPPARVLPADPRPPRSRAARGRMR